MWRMFWLATIAAAAVVLGLSSAATADPEYIYGIHDPGGESNMGSNKGWIVWTEEIGHDPNNQSGGNYSSWRNAGYGVIVRLNNGYGSAGTLPYQIYYPNFATRCANFVKNSSGVDYWIIGNEPNSLREWPGNNDSDPNVGEPITSARYINCYNQVWTAIKSVAPSAKVCPAPSGTWGPPYTRTDGQNIEGFLDYWVNCLNGIGASKIDALIIHCYTHGCTPDLVTDTSKMGPPYQNIYYNFQVYKNYMAAIPSSMNTKPVLMTECDQNIECADGATPRHAWSNVNNGWVRAIYSEINNWNTANSQKIRCVVLFRWQMAVEGPYTFGFSDRNNIIADFQQAVAYGYKWTTGGTQNDAGSGGDAGNDFNSALAISPGSYTGLASNSTDINDYYKFNVASSQLIQCTMTPPAGADFDLYLYDPTGAQRRSSTIRGSGTETINYTSDMTGDWRLRVYAYSGSGVYSFSVSFGLMYDGTPGGTNMATSATCTADSVYNNDPAWGCSKAVDGIVSGTSKWTSQGTSPPHWIALDLGQDRTVNGFVVRHSGAAGELTTYNLKNFTFQSGTSLSGPWTDECVVDNTAQANVTSRTYYTPKTLRYVRLYITNCGIDNYARLPEFEIWCSSAPDTTPPTISSITPSPTCVKTGGTVTVTATVTDNQAISQSGIFLPQTTNLLTNPSFENSLTGWTNTSSPIYSIGNNYPSPGTAKDGSCWAGTSCSWSSGVKTPELRQVVTVTAGSKYYLSVWVHTDGSPNVCSAFLQWKDGAATADGQCTTVASFTSNTSGWKRLYGIVTPTGSQLTYCLKLSWDCSSYGGGGNFDLAECRLAVNPSSYASNVATWTSVPISGSYTFSVYAKDDAGNANLATASTAVTTDDAPPHDFTPVANPPGWTSGNVSVTFSTTDSGCAGMNRYEVAIDSGSYSTATSPYTMTQPGTHVVHVKAFDNAGNVRGPKDVTTYIDTTAPSTPSVTDDGMYTTSTSQLHASWSSSDSESGIAEYQYAIGTTAGGTNVVGWTSTGTSSSVTKTGLTLSYNQPYYFSVKAKNGAGTWSGVGSSDGITVARPLATIVAAKGYSDGNAVQLADKPVSAKIGSAFWIEEPDRTSGMKVNSPMSVSPGAKMTVAGILATSQGERYLDQVSAAQNGTLTAPSPVGLANKELGGVALNAYTPGVKNGLGPNNIGLYAKVWGRVTKLGTDHFYIDDGAGLTDGTSTGGTANVGVRVLAAPGTLAVGDFVMVTGVSATFDSSGQHLRAVLPISGGVVKP